MATTAHSLPLKIQIVSDLHLESRQGLPTIKRAAPVLALLGDIGYASCGIEGDKLKQFLHAQTEMFDEVILLAGNHEYYGTSHEGGSFYSCIMRRGTTKEPPLSEPRRD